MGRVLRFTGPRSIDVVDEPTSEVGPEEVRVRTLFSGVSAGTELTAYRGTNPYLHRRWDPSLALFEKGAGDALAYPLVGWGYSEVGDIVEVGQDVRTLRVGDRVWGIWGHRTEAVIPESLLRGHVMDQSLDPRAGTFGRVGAVALNAVRNAPLGVGSVAAIVGLGVIGLLATRFAVLSGAKVVAVDPIERRRELALEWGAERAYEPADEVARKVRALSQGRGADVVIELSGSTVALHDAMRLAGPDGDVVAAGFYQGDATGLHLGEEFHHNRIHLRCSQIGAVPSHLAARWSRERLHLAAMERILGRDPDAAKLVTHEFALDEANRAYELLDERGFEALQVIFDMRLT